MQIVAPLQKRTERDKKVYLKINHLSCVTCHVSHIMCYMSWFTYHVSHVRRHMSHVAFHTLYVTCHSSLMPTATATDPYPANSSLMQGTKTPKKFKHTKKNHHNNYTQKVWRYAITSDRFFRSPVNRDLETDSDQSADPVKMENISKVTGKKLRNMIQLPSDKKKKNGHTSQFLKGSVWYFAWEEVESLCIKRTKNYRKQPVIHAQIWP